MKLKSITTGQEFSKPSEALHWYCQSIACADCPLDGKVPDDQPCEAILVDDFEGTLNKMGLEVVHNKPRLCEILGVEPYTPFWIRGNEYKISSGGWVTGPKDSDQRLTDILCAIHSPELVEHLPRWTADDIADAKAIKLLCPTATTIFRNETSVDVEDARGYALTVLRDRGDKPIVPSASAYEAVKLDDILNQAGGAE